MHINAGRDFSFLWDKDGNRSCFDHSCAPQIRQKSFLKNKNNRIIRYYLASISNALT